ncbi:hypothetical protein H5410_021745 [Solanum commersonii]|uniref:Uncharacterized protein n=1 Tax=Solanum commersonii TaxID=4109 RepID=A0A9J5ZF49_SOLCO|nr:hypothetical protein H5410_021745 [Solanum commersonii]
MSSFSAFAGDFRRFRDKPKTIADSDDTREPYCPSNLAWFLVIGLILPTVTSRMFSTMMQNLDPSIFADVDADANPDTDKDVDANFDAYAYFELIFLEAISITIEEQGFSMYFNVYVYVFSSLMKTSLYRLELGF